MKDLNLPEIEKHLPIVTIYPENAMAITKKGKRKDGSEYLIREQIAYLNTGKHHPIEFKLFIDNDSSPYPSGRYLLSASIFKVGDFNSLILNNREILLVPLTDAKK